MTARKYNALYMFVLCFVSCFSDKTEWAIGFFIASQLWLTSGRIDIDEQLYTEDTYYTNDKPQQLTRVAAP